LYYISWAENEKNKRDSTNWSKKLKDNDFKYDGKEEKLRDWSKYDKAQIHEINDMLLIIADFVDEAVKRLKIEKDPEKGPGRPSYPPDDIAKAILMQQYLGMANRSSEGLVILFKEKMRLRTTFSYKTIERSYEDPFVTIILNEVFKMTQEPVSDKEHSFAIDGTCLPTSIKQNWENDKPVKTENKTKENNNKKVDSNKGTNETKEKEKLKGYEK